MDKMLESWCHPCASPSDWEHGGQVGQIEDPTPPIVRHAHVHTLLLGLFRGDPVGVEVPGEWLGALWREHPAERVESLAGRSVL